MAIPFIATAIASLLGGAAAASEAGSVQGQNIAAATSAQQRRRQLIELAQRVQSSVTPGAGAREAASRQFTAASDQIGANAAQRGMMNAGNAGPGAQQNQVLAQILGQLAAQEMQNRQAANQLEANILTDPSFGVPNPETMQSPGSAALLALLGGAAGAGGSTIANWLGTEEGMKMLGWNPGQAATPQVFPNAAPLGILGGYVNRQQGG